MEMGGFNPRFNLWEISFWVWNQNHSLLHREEFLHEEEGSVLCVRSEKASAKLHMVRVSSDRLALHVRPRS